MITWHVQTAYSFRYIDGRVWPKEDELEVRLMMDLIHHVTGTHFALFITDWYPHCSLQLSSNALLSSIGSSANSCVCLAGCHGCCSALAIREAEIV